jgi:hypothetical protein
MDVDELETLFNADMEGVAPKAKEKKRKSGGGGSEGGGNMAASLIDMPGAKRSQCKKITLADKFNAKRSGLLCGICGKKDTDPDRVSPNCPMLWGYYKLEKGSMMVYVTDGATCWYCMRIWHARFQVEYPKLADYKAHCNKVRCFYAAPTAQGIGFWALSLSPFGPRYFFHNACFSKQS